MLWIKKANAASITLLTVFGFVLGVSLNQMPCAEAGDRPLLGIGPEPTEYQRAVREVVYTKAVLAPLEARNDALSEFIVKTENALAAMKDDNNLQADRLRELLQTARRDLEDGNRALSSAKKAHEKALDKLKALILAKVDELKKSPWNCRVGTPAVGLRACLMMAIL